MYEPEAYVISEKKNIEDGITFQPQYFSNRSMIYFLCLLDKGHITFGGFYLNYIR